VTERKDVFVVQRFALREDNYVAGVFTTMEAAIKARDEWMAIDDAEASIEPFELDRPRKL